MEQNFDSRTVLSGVFNFVTCQRDNGSFYGNGGTKCVKGVESTLPKGIAQGDFMKRLSPENQKVVAAAIEGVRAKIGGMGYGADGVQMWDAAIQSQFGELNGRLDPTIDRKTGKTVPPSYTEEKAVAQALRMWDPKEGRVATEMLGKTPTKLEIDGVKVDPSLNMVPEVRSAQIGWRDPITNTKFKAATLDKETGELVAPKNNAGRGESSIILSGSGKAMLDYREKLGANGWPPPPSVAPSRADIEQLSRANPEMWRSGFNIQDRGRNRSEAFDVYDIENKNPSAEVKALRQAKNDAVAEAYLAYAGRSALTGREIPPPVGGNHVTVDHITPLSSFAAPGRTKLQESMAANVASNFHIVERDLNQVKNDGTHAATVTKIEAIQGGGFTKKMTDNWGNAGSRVTLSEGEFKTRFPNAKGDFSDPAYRQQFASAYEQRRIAQMSGGAVNRTVPTTSRKRGGPDPMREFTRPSGTESTTPSTPRRPASSTTTPKARGSSGRTQTERDAAAAARRGRAQSRSAEQNQRKLDSLSKKTEAARVKRNRYKPGSKMYEKYSKEVNKAATEERAFRKENGV